MDMSYIVLELALVDDEVVKLCMLVGPKCSERAFHCFNGLSARVDIGERRAPSAERADCLRSALQLASEPVELLRQEASYKRRGICRQRERCTFELQRVVVRL